MLQLILGKFPFPTLTHRVLWQGHTGVEGGHLPCLPWLRELGSGTRRPRPEMRPLPIPLPTCCRTLAVSSGKVITSATQAAKPAEKIWTPMVGCASAAPSILAQTGSEPAAPSRPEGGGSALCPVLPSARAAARSLSPGSRAAGSPVVPAGTGGRRSAGVGPGRAMLPPFLLPRNTHCAPSAGTYVAAAPG